MTAELGLTLLGLAALDSLNPATLVAITLILLGSRRRPLAEALGFVVGAFATVLTAGIALYLGADVAAATISGALTWLRRGALLAAGLVLLVSAVRCLRTRRRSAVRLPDWFTVRTAAGLGVVMTGADLPNAFPYFIAVERLLAAEVAYLIAVVVLAAYATIYCVPCLVLLALGLLRGQRVLAWLNARFERFGAEAVLPPSPGRAALLAAAGLAVAAIALTI